VRTPSAHIARGFVLWRLSDAGHRAHGTVVHGRHPKHNSGLMRRSKTACYSMTSSARASSVDGNSKVL
jgi:hypothetical protein